MELSIFGLIGEKKIICYEAISIDLNPLAI
jgi:hypothetical protein